MLQNFAKICFGVMYPILLCSLHVIKFNITSNLMHKNSYINYNSLNLGCSATEKHCYKIKCMDYRQKPRTSSYVCDQILENDSRSHMKSIVF